MTQQEPLYPDITVHLTGQDGNVFLILARVRRALIEGGVDDKYIDEFFEEATADDYYHTLRTVARWVNVE